MEDLDSTIESTSDSEGFCASSSNWSRQAMKELAARGQGQKAGAGSQQIQVSGDLHVHNGIDEVRAAEIARDEARALIAEYSLDARPQAEERLERFDEALIPRLASAGLLDAFTDPSFHLALRKAQLGATATERENDYEMLAGLLTDRAGRGGERSTRVGIDKAIEIVDSLDDAALLGLTVAQAAIQYAPGGSDIYGSFSNIEKLFEELIAGHALPQGVDWLEHLDLLDAVRIDRVQNFVPYLQYLKSRCLGYVAPGLSLDDENLGAALQRFAALGPHGAPLGPHEFRPDYMRIFAASEDGYTRLLESMGFPADTHNECRNIAREMFGFGNQDGAAAQKFDETALNYPNVRKVNDWWSGWPLHFTVTAVGRVLASGADLKLLDGWPC